MNTNASAGHGFESTVATVAFVDLAGFSAITDVYGDASAIRVLGHFEELVSQALGELGPPIKWRQPRRSPTSQKNLKLSCGTSGR